MSTGTPAPRARAFSGEPARRAPTAFMCAEALPAKCHRLLLADMFTTRGWRVLHIVGGGSEPPRGELHALSPGARAEDGVLTYPGSGQTRLDLGRQS